MNQAEDTSEKWVNNNKGSLLIGLIAAITIIGAMGAGILVFMTGSTQIGLFSSAHSRAYYLAESGINVAKLKVADGITYTANTRFTLSNGDAFIIRTQKDPADASRTIIRSTGIVNPGSLFESKYDLTSNFLKKGGDVDLSDLLRLTVPDGKGNPVLNPIWSITGGAEVKDGKGTGNGSLGFQSRKGPRKDEGEKKIQTYHAIFLSLGWWKTSPGNPDFAQAWSDKNELLSYEAQIKVKVETKGGHGDHFMHGISFRLSPQDPDWDDLGSIQMYGISYFKSMDSIWPFNVRLDESFDAIMNNCVYIVLWEKSGSSDTLSLMDYRKLTASDDVLDGSDLKDWSTILLRLEEKFTGPGGTRQNHISGFIQGSFTNPLGAVEWDYGKYNRVQWKTHHLNPVLDNFLITTTFGTFKPDEIGLHAFYDSTADNKQYFADFGLKLGATGKSTSFQW